MSGCQVITFNYAIWAAIYPELAASVSEPQAEVYWSFAGNYCDNSPTSIVTDLTKRAQILGMITAHIASILAPLNGQPSNPLVGRISNASEGSVSVQTDMPTNPNAAWWNQTKYGALAWAALAPYRTMTYLPNPSSPVWSGGYLGRFR